MRHNRSNLLMDEIRRSKHRCKVARSILRLDERPVTIGENNYKQIDYYHVFLMGLMGSDKFLSPLSLFKVTKPI